MTPELFIVIIIALWTLMMPYARWQYRKGYHEGVQDTYKFLENFDRGVDEFIQDT
jgi:hypothetical protein